MLEEIQRRQLHPTAGTFNATLVACAGGRQCERALALLRDMYSCSAESDVISYNAAISACEKGHQLEQALGSL